MIDQHGSLPIRFGLNQDRSRSIGMGNNRSGRDLSITMGHDRSGWVMMWMGYDRSVWVITNKVWS